MSVRSFFLPDDVLLICGEERNLGHPLENDLFPASSRMLVELLETNN